MQPEAGQVNSLPFLKARLLTGAGGFPPTCPASLHIHSAHINSGRPLLNGGPLRGWPPRIAFIGGITPGPIHSAEHKSVVHPAYALRVLRHSGTMGRAGAESVEN